MRARRSIVAVSILIILLLVLSGCGKRKSSNNNPGGPGEPKNYRLNIVTNGYGTVEISPELDDYVAKTKVKLQAKPEPGWSFSHWSIAAKETPITDNPYNPDTYGHVTGPQKAKGTMITDNPYNLIIEEDLTIEVVFEFSESIQAAIDGASDGDVIVVPTGTYYENIVINGKNITLRSTNPTDRSVVEKTVIDGRGSGSVVTIINGANGELSGFTITNGGGTLKDVWKGGELKPHLCGGGIYIENASPTISRNIISGNINTGTSYSPPGLGGGIYVAGSKPHIKENEISNNGHIKCIALGGGIYLYEATDTLIDGNEIKSNSAAFGGGITLDYTHAIVSNNTITGNFAYIHPEIFHWGDSKAHYYNDED
ncbi:MAG: DUF1565 domain-containing protein [Firmicutes bacterium]|nr:DUF1565 domain-containing protein [Bacillota bacterium]